MQKKVVALDRMSQFRPELEKRTPAAFQRCELDITPVQTLYSPPSSVCSDLPSEPGRFIVVGQFALLHLWQGGQQ
jgi:hypothetical protein